MSPFDGLGLSLGSLPLLSGALTRSLSPENPTGEPGRGGMATEGTGARAARELGPTWKINPCVHIEAGQTFTLADIAGPGAIQQVWLTPTGHWRFAILRVYWDGERSPSIEVPLGDFFCMGWCRYAPLSSLAVCVNPGSGFNCYWLMPFRKHCRVTVENIAAERMTLFYQVNYTLTDVPPDAAYLHAQFRRTDPLPYKEVFTILDHVQGQGHYVGTYIAWGVNSSGWWGEGEVKFYIDSDREYPTICGTGTEDYFQGSYDFENPETKQYETFTTPYSGLCQVLRPDGLYMSQQRFGMYRWHILDPVRFREALRVTIQALGWRSGGRYMPLQDDIAATAWWYQAEPHAPFPPLPGKDDLEVV